METNNILDRMASYDFKAPINIVYFEENSDDEIDLTSSPKSKDEENNNVNTEIESNRTEKVTDPVSGKNVEKIEDEKKNNARKRKSATETKESKKNNKNIKHNTKTIDSPKIPMTRKDVNTIYKASDSLKTISKYLTLILESLHYNLLAASNKNCTPDQLALSKKNYLTVKYHFFKAAYEHFNSHILPNENNQAFIHNFLNYTIDMANNRIKIDCRNGITEIYFEMMKWVKKRKLKDFSDSCKTPILLKHLNDPPVIPDITISESIKNDPPHYSSKTDQDTLCIFSSGPPGNQMNISVDKSLLTHNSQGLRNTRLPQRKVTQQNLNNQHNFCDRTSPNGIYSVTNINNLENNYGNRQSNGELMNQQNNLMQPVVPANGYVLIADNRVPYYPAPPNHLRNITNECNQISPNSNFNYYHTTNNFQNNNYFSANNFTHNGTSHVPNTVQENGSFRTYRRDHPPRPDLHVPPPPYHSPAAVHPNQMTQPVTTAPTILHGLSSGPDLTRSSISADSGFVSPVASKSNTNPIEEIMNDLFELENTVEPPRVAPSAQAGCHVCHKKARLMCSACFKTTYCNATCQRMDWEAHRLFCPPSTGKRSQ